MGAISTINQTLSNSPLPELIEKLGMAITQAQAALDKNSLNTLKEMSSHKMLINNREYNLLSLGFTPTFYGFTEASIETKMAFSMSEETSISLGGKVSVETKVVAVTVDASYSRKFEQSAEGSSSIAAKLVALPPPEKLLELLKEENDNRIIEVTSFEVLPDLLEISLGQEVQFEVKYSPSNATSPTFQWEVTNTHVLNATISESGVLKLIDASNDADHIFIKVTCDSNVTQTIAPIIKIIPIKK
jgi:hypothetical protein